ncbi:MAG: GreA/GreB family elongation factor [Chthoniobacterales bacterium]|nr:GreA/GreB family elongation factor [Chthoniobacterales bacterium]
MSRAFVRESDDAPDLPVAVERAAGLPPGAKNYLTRSGAKKLREELARLIEQERPPIAKSGAPDARRQLASVDQRIEQLEQSLQSAEIVDPIEGPTDVVRFGATVTVREANAEESTYRIVGVAEMNADRGWISWQSPVAKALLNARLGERVRFPSPSGDQDLEVMAITYD